MITVADHTHYSGINYLYRTCFGTDAAYMKAYFNRLLPTGENIVYVHNDTVVSTLTLFPCTIQNGSVKFKVGYIFSVGTLEHFRRNGFASQLLEWTADYARNKNFDAVTLVPQSPRLTEFYQKFGYMTTFYANRTIIRNYQLPSESDIKPIKFVKMNRGFDVPAIFANIHSDRFFLHWDRKMYEHLRIDAGVSGGGLLYANVDGADLLAAGFGRKRVDKLLIKDFAVPPQYQLQALLGVRNFINAGSFEILTPSDCTILDYPAENVPYGMCLPLNETGIKMLDIMKTAKFPVFYSPLVD